MRLYFNQLINRGSVDRRETVNSPFRVGREDITMRTYLLLGRDTMRLS